MEDYLLTVSEVAQRLKTNRNFVYSLINTGLLKSLKLGSKKVRNAEINRFLEQYEGQDIDKVISDLA